MAKRKAKVPLQDLDAGYMRVSEVTVNDGEDRDEVIARLVEVRAKELREAAARQGREIPDELMFADMDLSGTSVDKRPQMMAMLQAAKRGEFARLWVKNLSRLFRNLQDQCVYVGKIEAAGVEIISLQEPAAGERALVNLTRGVLGAMNEYMADATGELIKRNNRQIASLGRWASGTPPLGYLYDKNTKQLIPDPVRVSDALAVFETYEDLGTYVASAAALNARGIRTRNGALWRHDKVKLIVNNPVYRGRIPYDGESWPGNHERIIPDDLIKRVDAQIEAGRHQRDSSQRKRAYKMDRTYSGILICGLCGDKMRANPGRWKDHEHIYWICSSRKDRGVCSMPLYRTEELDHFVLAGVKHALDLELDALAAFAQDYPDPVETTVARRSSRDRASIEAKMLRLATEYAEGYLAKEQYRKLIDQYRAQISDLEQSNDVAKEERPAFTADAVERFRASIDEGWAQATEGARRKLVQAIAPAIRVYPDKITILTILSIGDFTIPTMMFERVATEDASNPCPGGANTDRARAGNGSETSQTDSKQGHCHRAPDRTRTCASGSGGLHSIH